MSARPERYTDTMLINVDEIQDATAPVRIEAVGGLARLIELLETARQDPDYQECEGDGELFKHLTWAAAQIAGQPQARPAKRKAA